MGSGKTTASMAEISGIQMGPGGKPFYLVCVVRGNQSLSLYLAPCAPLREKSLCAFFKAYTTVGSA